MDRPLPNSYWVIPGRLLAGEYPGDPDPAQARLRLARLRDAGIDSFVDLTEEYELPPYSLWLPKQAEYLRSPIVDTGVPNNVSHTRALLAAIHAALARGQGSLRALPRRHRTHRPDHRLLSGGRGVQRQSGP